MENCGKVQIIQKSVEKSVEKLVKKLVEKSLQKLVGKPVGKSVEKSLQTLVKKLLQKLVEKVGEKSVKKALKNLWKNWWKNRWKKGRVQKKSLELVWSLTKPGGRGVSKGRQKSKPQVCKCIFSVSMQNHSRTPKTCFTLGLECLCHIYSH